MDLNELSNTELKQVLDSELNKLKVIYYNLELIKGELNKRDKSGLVLKRDDTQKLNN
jgi:hypothetical protein